MDAMDYTMDEASPARSSLHQHQQQQQLHHQHHAQSHPQCQVAPIYLPPPDYGMSRASSSREMPPYDPVYESTQYNNPHLVANPTPFGQYMPPQFGGFAPAPGPDFGFQSSHPHNYSSPYAYMNRLPEVRGTPFNRPVNFPGPQSHHSYSSYAPRNTRPISFSNDFTSSSINPPSTESILRDMRNRAQALSAASREIVNSNSAASVQQSSNISAPTRSETSDSGPSPQGSRHARSTQPHNPGPGSMPTSFSSPTNHRRRGLHPPRLIDDEDLLAFGLAPRQIEDELALFVAMEGRSNPEVREAIRSAMTAKTRKRPSEEALSSLIRMTVEELKEAGEELNCMICYNDFGVANPEGVIEKPLRLPKCKHIFGDVCIQKWFEDSDTCPYCRDKLPSASSSGKTALLERLARARAGMRAQRDLQDEDDMYELQLGAFQRMHQPVERFSVVNGVRGSTLESPERRRTRGRPNGRSGQTTRPSNFRFSTGSAFPPNLVGVGTSTPSFGTSVSSTSNLVSPAVAVGSSPAVNENQGSSNPPRVDPAHNNRRLFTSEMFDEMARLRNGPNRGSANNSRFDQGNSRFAGGTSNISGPITAGSNSEAQAQTFGSADDLAQYAQRWSR